MLRRSSCFLLLTSSGGRGGCSSFLASTPVLQSSHHQQFAPVPSSPSAGTAPAKKKKNRTQYWTLENADGNRPSADVLITKALSDVPLPPEVDRVLQIAHPTEMSCFQAVPFILGHKSSLDAMSLYYRRMLRNAEPAAQLLKSTQMDRVDHFDNKSDSNITHLNAGRTLLSFVVCNTNNGPCLQRYLMFPYGTAWNDVKSIPSQFARRQVAACWVTSLMGCHRFVTKTNALEWDGKTIITRRFIEGVDMPKYLEIKGEDSLRAKLSECDQKTDLMRMVVTKTACNPLDLFNPHNVLVPRHNEERDLARVVSVDHELEFPSTSMCRWFRDRNQFFKFDEDNMPRDPDTPRCAYVIGSWHWRTKQTRERGQMVFAKRQLEVGKASGYLSGHPWANLMLLRNDGDIDKTLNEHLEPEAIESLLRGAASANRVMDLLDISKFSRLSFECYLDHFRAFVKANKNLTLMDVLAPVPLEEATPSSSSDPAADDSSK